MIADLGPAVEDYYQPSQYGMTTQEMDVELTVNLRALAPKIIQAVDAQMTIDWLSSMMTTITNGYKIMKELMRQHIPSLKPAKTSSAYAVNPKPKYIADTNIHSFNARCMLWLQIEQKHGRTYAERKNTHYFIGQLDKDPHYKEAITEAKQMYLIDSTATIPTKIQYHPRCKNSDHLSKPSFT